MYIIADLQSRTTREGSHRTHLRCHHEETGSIRTKNYNQHKDLRWFISFIS